MRAPLGIRRKTPFETDDHPGDQRDHETGEKEEARRAEDGADGDGGEIKHLGGKGRIGEISHRAVIPAVQGDRQHGSGKRRHS